MIFSFSPQLSFCVNSNVHVASALTLQLRSHIADVTLRSEVPLSSKPNASDGDLFWHGLSHKIPFSDTWRCFHATHFLATSPSCFFSCVNCLALFGCFLALFCQCLADPQSNDHTIVLYLFPATFSKTATTRDQRHTSLLSFNLKASLVDLSSFFFKGKQCSSSSPKIAMWSTCTTNSKHRCTRPHPRP